MECRSPSVRLATLEHRVVLLLGDEVADIATASDGAFGPDPMELYEQWDRFVDWASGPVTATGPLDLSLLGCPVPMPRQVFAIGLNYRAHAEECGMEIPTVPAAFTKFPASLSGPFDDIELVGEMNDWEAELVVVMGRRADRVDEAAGWAHVAGLTIGQDVSDRLLQFAAAGQFSLGKSRRGYGPIGPCVVTAEEVADPDNLGIGCSVDGVTVQEARTDDLIFSVPALIAELSAVVPLLPGDLIFTGTPAGIGLVREPPQFLQRGQVLETWIEGIGTIRNRCV